MKTTNKKQGKRGRDPKEKPVGWVNVNRMSPAPFFTFGATYETKREANLCSGKYRIALIPIFASDLKRYATRGK